jgi:hypothetical protein
MSTKGIVYLDVRGAVSALSEQSPFLHLFAILFQVYRLYFDRLGCLIL